MIAVCIPTWGRVEFTEMCLNSFFKYTNFNIVTKSKVYINPHRSNGIEMENLIKVFNINYEIGDFYGAWVGFNKFLKEIINDKSIKYIAKIDNDVLFTRKWIEPIMDEFNKDETIGSIRYGRSMSNGKVSPLVKNDGFSGGLKVFKKELYVPFEVRYRPDNKYFGSEVTSERIIKQGFTVDSMEVGVHMLDLLYPDLESKYKGMGIQRVNMDTGV